MMPVKTKNPPAPEKHLSSIRCICKTNCETRRCSCRKHGLECNISCGECRGQNCLNSKSVEMGVESEELILSKELRNIVVSFKNYNTSW